MVKSLQNKQAYRYGELMREFAQEDKFYELIGLLLIRYEEIGTGDKFSWMMKQLNETLEVNKMKGV